jgi:transposase
MATSGEGARVRSSNDIDTHESTDAMRCALPQRGSPRVQRCIRFGAASNAVRQHRYVGVIRPGANVGAIYLHREPVDMRKAINGLVALVEGEMALDPFSSALFVFCNRNRTVVKMVCWEGNGFVLWMKRLEKWRFKWPLLLPDEVIELNAQQVNWLCDGYDLTLIQGHAYLPHHTVL